MKTIATALLAASLVSATAPAFAAPVCLDIVRIDRTSVPDAKHIVFHMLDGTKWTNTLLHSCPGLRFNGFAYEPTASRYVCENLQTIRVLDDGSPCMLGKFSRGELKKAT